jgi:hypothetical protein
MTPSRGGQATHPASCSGSFVDRSNTAGADAHRGCRLDYASEEQAAQAAAFLRSAEWIARVPIDRRFQALIIAMAIDRSASSLSLN